MLTRDRILGILVGLVLAGPIIASLVADLITTWPNWN